MIAVDTNLLVYAHRQGAEFHVAAANALRGLAEGSSAWAIPWPCIHEFVAIVTHPRIFVQPSTKPEALDEVAAWAESPSLSLLGEGPGYLERLEAILTASEVRGARIHDGRVAALCLYHGVRELWTADRDFSRFAAVTTRNPLFQ